MPPQNINYLLNPVYDIYYDTYFEERCADEESAKWKFRDDITSIIVAITTPTASGSAVVVWNIWETVIGQIIWGIIAGIASILAIIHKVFEVTRNVKEYGELRQKFLDLRIDIGTFSVKLGLGLLDINQAVNQFNMLLDRYAECMKNTLPKKSLAFLKKIQQRVDQELPMKGWL